jgi:tetratricopeptide (TPR) repeat protein
MIATLDLVQKANQLVNDGHFEEAILAYDEALAQSSNDPGLLHGKAYALYATGRLDEAAKAYDAAISIDRGNAELWRASGVVAEQLSKLDEALDRYEKALELSPDSPQFLSDKADVLLALGRTEDALASYRSADTSQPPGARDWIIRGHRFYSADRPKEADACYSEALALDPDDFEAWWGKGLAAGAQNELTRALEFLDKAAHLADEPEDKARILTDKGNELAKQPDSTQQALDCYAHALAADPRNEDAHLGTAILLENMQKYSEAITAYEQLTQLNAKRADAWEGKGRCLTNLPERMREAVECYDNAIKSDPESFSAHADKGWALIELKRYSESVDECDTAIRLLREEPVPWVNKAFALMELGRYEECERFLKEGVQIVREPKMLQQNLGLLYSDYTFDEIKSLEVTREILKSDDDPTTRMSYAECLLRVGNYAEARDAARGLEKSGIGPIRDVAGFIGLASCALEGNAKESDEYFRNLMDYMTEENRVVVTEKHYFFRGLTKRLLEKNADPITKFVLLTLIDILVGKLDWNEFSFRKAVSPTSINDQRTTGA